MHTHMQALDNSENKTQSPKLFTMYVWNSATHTLTVHWRLSINRHFDVKSKLFIFNCQTVTAMKASRAIFSSSQTVFCVCVRACHFQCFSFVLFLASTIFSYSKSTNSVCFFLIFILIVKLHFVFLHTKISIIYYCFELLILFYFFWIMITRCVVIFSHNQMNWNNSPYS